MNEYRCKRIAREYFWPELGGKNKPGWVLHHKDPSWKTEDPERYHQWNIEDLIPMTIGQHTKWHAENDPEFNGGKSGENAPYFGKRHSLETKQKMREHHLGEKNAFFGKHHSEESRKKMSEARLGKHHSAETKQKMSEAKSGEKCYAFGLHWYNNGEVNVFQKICPPGFVKGRILNK